MTLEPTPGEWASPQEPALSALRHNRNFRLLWIGQILSDLGSQFGALAYPLLILVLTKSPVLAGVVGTSTAVAAFVVRLPAGSLADRFDRRHTMIVCDGVRTVVLGMLALGVVVHVVSWPVVLVVAIIDRVGDTLFSPASTAALPSLVHDDQLEAAWAATEARQYAASLGGPALGGILFSAGRAVPFIGDTLSYGVSVFTSMRMKGNFRAAKPAGETRGLWAASFDAIGHVWRDPLLRAVIIQAPLINFAFSGIVFTVTIALEHAGKPAVEIGLTQSAIMVGGLLGAIAAPRIQGRFSLWALVVMLTAGGSALITIAALIMPSPLAAIPITIPFFLAPTANAALFAAMFRTTPEAMRGRVNNALIQLSTGLAALSPLLAGLLVEHASSHWAMGAFAVALATSAVMAVSLSALRVASREATTPASP